jgi:hypothetical protein
LAKKIHAILSLLGYNGTIGGHDKITFSIAEWESELQGAKNLGAGAGAVIILQLRLPAPAPSLQYCRSDTGF